MRKEFEAECLIGKEAISLVKESKKAVPLVAGLYLLSLIDCQTAHVIRASYYPMRRIDNWLDLDSKNLDTHLGVVQALRSQIDSGIFTGEQDIAKLLDYVLPILEEKAGPRDNPRQDFINAIDAIVFDSERAKGRKVLSGNEIEEYYRRTFDPVLNIFLLGLGSRFRSADIPALSYGQGRIYSLRDLEEDWRFGIVNIPGEVLERAGLHSSSSFSEVNSNSVINDWSQDELSRTEPDLIVLEKKLRESGERKTDLVCRYGLIRPLLSFIEARKD